MAGFTVFIFIYFFQIQDLCITRHLKVCQLPFTQKTSNTTHAGELPSDEREK